jgi:hypothetical protein
MGSKALEAVRITNWFDSLNPVKVKRMRLGAHIDSLGDDQESLSRHFIAY